MATMPPQPPPLQAPPLKKKKSTSSDAAKKQRATKSQTTENGHANKASSSESATEIDDKTDDEPDYEVEKVVDKKVYKSKVWYKLKWVGWVEPTWELAKNCKCDQLIKDYERMIEEQSKDEDENEWEVEEILDKRTTKDDQVEYLLKWKNWKGAPTWTKEKDCDCINLIASYENPKLKKLWDFCGSNTRLWLDRSTMVKYMKNYAKSNDYCVRILKFEPDFPPDERPFELQEGINIGPLCYKNHWYLVIILVNHIHTTKALLICDPLNTLIGVPNTRVHPVYKRMIKVYPSFTMTPVAMTPMLRSDTCAYHVLAAYERALFCLRKNAKFIINKLFFDQSIPELIRTRLAPETDHEMSVNLLYNSAYLNGPKCEFCGIVNESTEEINDHIINEHFTKDCSRANSINSIDDVVPDHNGTYLSIDPNRSSSTTGRSQGSACQNSPPTIPSRPSKMHRSR